MGNNRECALCRDEKPFEMPQEIIEAISRRDIVLFAGAGVSTESKHVLPQTLYEDIRLELEDNDEPGTPSKFSRTDEFDSAKRGAESNSSTRLGTGFLILNPSADIGTCDPVPQRISTALLCNGYHHDYLGRFLWRVLWRDSNSSRPYTHGPFRRGGVCQVVGRIHDHLPREGPPPAFAS